MIILMGIAGYVLVPIGSLILLIMLLITAVLLIKAKQVNEGRIKTEEEIKSLKFDKIKDLGSVKSLSILPLVDFKAAGENFKTENGVSYLIKADDKTILLDVGYNSKKEDPSPLCHNMEKLSVKIKDIDMLFISHPHLDHIGGMDEQKNRQFSFTQSRTDLNNLRVYSPVELTPSEFNPDASVEVIKEPKVISQGIASIGVIPRYLYIMGYTEEHSLAINVEGKGIVLIIGCGHQTIERIVERAKMIFDEPIYGIIGGLHFPVKGDIPESKGGLIAVVQRMVGSDYPPWKGLSTEHVLTSISFLKQVNPKIIALSPHDSSDWTMKQFSDAFDSRFSEIKVGQEIQI